MESGHGLVFSLCALDLPSRGTELNNHGPLVLLHRARSGRVSCGLSISRPGCAQGLGRENPTSPYSRLCTAVFQCSWKGGLVCFLTDPASSK